MRTFTARCDARECEAVIAQNPFGTLPEGWEEYRVLGRHDPYIRDVQVCPEHVLDVDLDAL